jgi:HD-GYP domain-containing protein (c-di-GMP phosphodiesterase class II)
MGTLGERGVREVTTSSLRPEAGTDLETASIVCLLSVMDSIDQHEPGGEGRCRRIALHAVATARAMLQPSNVVELVRLGALFCNIGMITVPEELVSKRGQLSDLEWQLIQQHPLRSTEILAALPHLREVLPAVLHHHENWQGDGYPHKLSGEQIPIGARIIRVADTYEALISLRPYRPAYSSQEAVQFLVRGMGAQFDPRVVKTFVRQLERVASGDDLLEHWTTLQGEARLQRVMTSIPLRKRSPQGGAGTGLLGRTGATSEGAQS